jgi:hypothetical protein
MIEWLRYINHVGQICCHYMIERLRYYNHVGNDNSSGQHGCNTLTTLSCNDNRSGQHGRNTLTTLSCNDNRSGQHGWGTLTSLSCNDNRSGQHGVGITLCWPDLLSLHDRVVKVLHYVGQICCHYMIERLRYLNYVGQQIWPAWL